MSSYTMLEVSPRVFDEIRELLDKAGHGHRSVINAEPPRLLMNGISLQRKSSTEDSPGPASLTVTSSSGVFAVKTALARAAFHLKKQGYGKDDVALGEIIEQLDIKVNS